MQTFGYIRVSSKEQNIDRQIEALKEYNIPSKNLFSDWQSGKDFNRPAYQKLLRKIKKGDVLIIKSIDRLGRNYDEILKEWKCITKEIGADIVVIDMPLLNTGKGFEDLTRTFIADLVLQILAYVAQTERENIHQRQAEGIAVAKAKGVKFGRRPYEMPQEFEELKLQWQEGKISTRKAAQKLGMSHATFYRRCTEK